MEEEFIEEEDSDLEEEPLLLSKDALPSQTTSHAWIGVSSPNRPKVVISYDDLETYGRETTVGKWLLFQDKIAKVDGELSAHDKAWLLIKSLVLSSKNSGITSAKCSTMWSNKYAGSSSDNQGVICCYTEDYRDKGTVKRAADAIREIYNFPRDMFYKTDRATYAKKYRETGDSAISIYKHCVSSRFYERDAAKKWILVWRV